MGRFRNPRFAPESLERRMNPTTLVAAVPVPTAEVMVLGSTDTDPTPLPDGDGSPPIEVPTIPPPGPAVPV